MLSDILKSGKCFKLVCGAGNEDVDEVEKLVYLYSKAGCDMFDLSANIEVVRAAKRGLELAGKTECCYLCVSVGIKGDPHINKANIDTKKCSKCKICENICPQNAIEKCLINNSRCIGCSRCENICPQNAIFMKSYEADLDKILPPIIAEGIDCLEFHAIVEDNRPVIKKWKKLNKIYSGMMSICLDRSKLSNESVVNRIYEMIKMRNPYTTIIQADGAPMSGGKDDFKTTLQAVAMAEIIQDANMPVYILLSGGTNSKTAELAKLCGIDYSGIAIGSYARKIVKKYISQPDFMQNKEIFNKALLEAKNLINLSKS